MFEYPRNATQEHNAALEATSCWNQEIISQGTCKWKWNSWNPYCSPTPIDSVNWRMNAKLGKQLWVNLKRKAHERCSATLISHRESKEGWEKQEFFRKKSLIIHISRILVSNHFVLNLLACRSSSVSSPLVCCIWCEILMISKWIWGP